MRATDRFRLCGQRAVVLAGLLVGAVTCQAQPPAVKGKVMIADVHLDGNLPIPAQQILAQLKTRPGAEYVPDMVPEDVRTLDATGLYGKIQSVVKPEPDGRVTVSFFCNEKFWVVEEVVYQGACHLSKDDLDSLTFVRKGDAVRPRGNRHACEAIASRLHEHGWLFAQCDLLSGGQPSDTRVIFNITEGPRIRLRRVRFVGNTFADDERLFAMINSKTILGLLPGIYAPQVVEADICNLEDYYRKFGYLDAHVARELHLTEDGRNINLIFHIREGPRYTILSAPHVYNSQTLPVEELERLCRVKPGQFYNQADVDDDVHRIERRYHSTGQVAKVQFVPIFDRDPASVCTVNYEVEEEPPTIHLSGTDDTGTRIDIRIHKLPFPGQVLTSDDDPALYTLLGLVATAERVDHSYYTEIVRLFVELDRQGTIELLRRVISSFSMPAVHLLSESRQRMADIRAMNIFTDDIFYVDVYLKVLEVLGIKRTEMKQRQPSRKSLSAQGPFGVRRFNAAFYWGRGQK